MSYLALVIFAALSLGTALLLLALARWWSPPSAPQERRQPHARLPLAPYRALFFILFGEMAVIFLCAWAVDFRAGWAQGRGYLVEMGLLALVALIGLFHLWRKEGRA